MARLIDADALIGALHNHAFLEGDDRSICYNIIQKQPTIEAVPVIRCKDCKHHGEQYGNGYCMKDGCYGWYDEDYCSRAERKETR